MPPTIVHFSTATLPRVVVTDADGSAGLDLLLPFRIDLVDRATVRTWRLQVLLDDGTSTPRVRTRPLRPGLAAEIRERCKHSGAFSFTHLPYYAAVDKEGNGDGRVFLEGRVPDVPDGAAVRYTLTVTGDVAGVPFTVTSPTYRTRVVDPRFTRAEVARTVMPDPRGSRDAYVLLHRRRAGVDAIRVDVLDLAADGTRERPRLRVEVDGARVVDLYPGAPEVVDVPLVDIAADSVTVAVPHAADAPEPTVTVRYRYGDPDAAADPADVHRLAEPTPCGTARIAFVNFAIQGLNDLFATPDDDYAPPRTYTQLTMRDEQANYSSHPGNPENGDGDGYRFTIDAHRRFEVPQMWAMNGGLLGLLAHDDPDHLARMADDAASGRLVPVIAGYGAHRLPYYSKTTNLDAMNFGSEALQNILGHTRPVYYPDSRITVDKANITDALREAGIRFLVVDADSGNPRARNTLVEDVRPTPMGDHDAHGRFLDWRYLWHDRSSDAHVLFIDGETKDKLLSTSPDDADRGTLAFDLRSLLLDFAGRPTVRAGNLVVYSDDADKASGNGWFDGSSGNNQRYQAALWWVHTHPWVQAVTTDDLGPADSVGDLDLKWASDPYIQPKGVLDGDVPAEPGHDNGLVYDQWYGAWARTPAEWLGENLRALSDRAETAIRRRLDQGDHAKSELVTLARLYFLMNLHESQWSKRARIAVAEGYRPHWYDDAAQTEDFVVAESLQLRNAHVYLNASLWAEWAAEVATGAAAPGAHRDDGPVVEAVAAFEDQGFGAAPRPPWITDGALGLHWDHDPLTNVVLYNEQALVVIDRNGGRITHVFAMVDGRPLAVSGTHKAYQFLDLDWGSDAGIECDGLVLQNTVCTPNHAYVACDRDASGPTAGDSPTSGEVYDWGYPDNFNAYTEQPCSQAGGPAVAFTYGDGTPGATVPTTIAELRQALADDLAEKAAGRRGRVLHDVGRFGDFGKTIRLDGRTVHVAYRGTRPGHRVANEFCVDLLRAALHGQRQDHAIAADGRSGTVTNAAGVAVRVECDAGCVFSAAPGAGLDPATAPRLHRVMTDDLELVAPDGGDFAYRIVLPG